MARTRIDPGQLAGRFSTVRVLGGGGGGQVWLAAGEGEGDEKVAVKFLTKLGPVPQARFKDEIRTLQALRGTPGILPIIAHHVPEDLDETDPAWFAMPLAEQIDEWRKGKDDLAVARLALDVGRTLEASHTAGFSHRDIKPQNLVFWHDRGAVIDFGLVSFEGKDEVTEENAQLGPRWTMAPEMRRDPTAAAGKPADVYSLAKTLWILLTGEFRGFDGQYLAGSGVGLSRFDPARYTVGLDELLQQSTDHEPDARPSMSEFCVRLERWIAELGDWNLRCGAQWAHVPRQLFPRAVPVSATWSDLPSIVTVLNAFASTRSLNHMFLPDMGGLDMASVSVGSEPGTIEIGVEDNSPRMRIVVRPSKLQFEAVSQAPEWSYLRLETEGLAMVSNGIDPQGVRPEEVVEVAAGEYAPRSAWDEDEYLGDPLPKSARLLTRYPRGSFVIFQKSGPYNQSGGGYGGEHEKLGGEAFREQILRAAERSAATALGGADYGRR